MGRFVKTVITALQFLLAASVAALIYGFAVKGVFTPAYIFPACFITGAGVICVALVVMILPSGFKPDRLTDHTTFAERYYEKRREKQKKAYGFLSLGLAITIIAGLLQLLLSPAAGL